MIDCNMESGEYGMMQSHGLSCSMIRDTAVLDSEEEEGEEYSLFKKANRCYIQYIDRYK